MEVFLEHTKRAKSMDLTQAGLPFRLASLGPGFHYILENITRQNFEEINCDRK